MSPDRLSELPDSLIFEIFWLLPMTDVVKTTVLSRRWKNLWTTSPYLNFKDCDPTGSFLKIIYCALGLWKGTRIVKFKIDLSASLFRGLDVWVHFAKEKQVKEFYVDLDGELRVWGWLRNGTRERGSVPQRVPQCLYLCSSLKELSLRCCIVEIHGNVYWNQLKRLTIDGCDRSISQRAIKQILCGSPKLEGLSIMEHYENLSIESTSLRELVIEKHMDHDLLDNRSTETELRIWTPNLQTLKIGGVPYSECLLMDVSSLTRVTLGFFRPPYDVDDLFCRNGGLEKTLRQILPAIQHVERVELSDWCIKVIRAMKNKYMLSPLQDVKSLHGHTVVSKNTKK